MTNITVAANSHILLSLGVMCVFTTMAMPVTTRSSEQTSDELLRNLKRGLLSADSVLVCYKVTNSYILLTQCFITVLHATVHSGTRLYLIIILLPPI